MGIEALNNYNQYYSNLQEMDKNKDGLIHPKEYDEFNDIPNDTEDNSINPSLYCDEIRAYNWYGLSLTFDVNKNKRIDIEEGKALDLLLNGDYKALDQKIRAKLALAKTDKEKVGLINVLIYINDYFGYKDAADKLIDELAKYDPSDIKVTKKRLIPLLAKNDFNKAEEYLNSTKANIPENELLYIKMKQLHNAEEKDIQSRINEFVYILCNIFKTGYGEFKEEDLGIIKSLKKSKETEKILNRYVSKLFDLAMKHKEYKLINYIAFLCLSDDVVSFAGTLLAFESRNAVNYTNYMENKLEDEIKTILDRSGSSFQDTVKCFKTKDKKIVPYLASLIIKRNFQYKVTDSKGYDDVETTFNKLQGDCENLSFAARSLLKDCGYESAYIAVDTGFALRHAICIFKDNEGYFRVIDNTGLDSNKFISLDTLFIANGMKEAYIYEKDMTGIFVNIANNNSVRDNKYPKGLIPFYTIK